MKVRLMTGEDAVLTPSPKAKRDVFPPEVAIIAKQHWQDSTIPEPSVRRRMKRKERKLQDGERADESVATRWQHLSAKEQYACFKEDCSEKVKLEMRKQAQSEMAKVMGRPETEDKRNRIRRIESLPQCFPGKKWYFSQKPAEIKPLIDHTTGLCRYCEQAGLNYQTLAKTLKRLCACGTHQCPNWTCLCQADGEEDEELVCKCRCSCDNCRSCQVLELIIIMMMI